ncbi:MAG: SUMF1/EgtB/PvdO family nonheme iron enzyme [Bacteroidota bacterium]
MKTLTLFLFAVLLALSPAAQAQSLLLKAGPAVTQAPDADPVTQAGFQIGSRIWLAEFFQVQGMLGYTDEASAEVTMNVRPFSGARRFEPYVFSGFGLFFSGDDHRAVIPVGVGMDYSLNDRVALNFELAARWTLFRDLATSPGAPNGLQELGFGIFPAVGVNYTFAKASRYDPEVIAEARAREQGQVARRDFPSQDPALVSRDATTGGGQVTTAPGYGTAQAGGGALPAQPGITAEGQPGYAPAVPAGQSVGMPVQGTVGRTVADPVARQGALSGSYQVPGAASIGGAAAQPVGLPQQSGFPQGGGIQPAGVSQAGDMVLVPDGTYTMGLFEEDPLGLQTQGFKRVTVSSFFIDKFEVTNMQFRQWLQSLAPSAREAMTPDSMAWQEAGGRANFQSYFLGQAYNDYPVVAVTWDQANAYCQAQGKRLPTEAEWEYVARSGVSGGIYPWPGQSPQAPNGGYYANYNPGRAGYAADGYAFTAPVGAFPSSPWGIFNMSGNVAEWTLDAYNPTYSVLADFNPRWVDDRESRRIVRGGSWAAEDFYIGVGVREAFDMNDANIYTGFRCSKDLGSEFGPAPGQAQGGSDPAGGFVPPVPPQGGQGQPGNNGDQNGGGQ